MKKSKPINVNQVSDVSNEKLKDIELLDGGNITIEEGKALLRHFIKAQGSFRDAVDKGKLNDHAEAKGYADDISKVNVFVFDKKFIERYSPRANKYVIVLGANSDLTSTVMFAGCTIENVGGNKIKIHVVPPPDEPLKPISEHPPKRLADNINKLLISVDSVFSEENGELVITIKK